MCVHAFLNFLILNYRIRELMSFVDELNKVQQDAVKSVEGPVMIVAGAGSGKTRVLTYRVAYLISIGVPAYQVLVLTFTNKAADEMKKELYLSSVIKVLSYGWGLSIQCLQDY